jgi:hypothetical protein
MAPPWRTQPSSEEITTTNHTLFAVPTGSNGCLQQVAASASCTFSVVFSPTAINVRSNGLLTLTSNTSVPLLLPVAGDSAALGLSAPGNSSSATITPGGTATYTLSIGGQGISGPVGLSCTGAPQGAVCTTSGVLPLDPNNASTFTVTVKTTAASAGLILPPSAPIHWLWATSLLGIMALSF